MINLCLALFAFFLAVLAEHLNRVQQQRRWMMYGGKLEDFPDKRSPISLWAKPLVLAAMVWGLCVAVEREEIINAELNAAELSGFVD